jgi:hypothetical protein
MQNRTSGPYLAAINRILISLMTARRAKREGDLVTNEWQQRLCHSLHLLLLDVCHLRVRIQGGGGGAQPVPPVRRDANMTVGRQPSATR